MVSGGVNRPKSSSFGVKAATRPSGTQSPPAGTPTSRRSGASTPTFAKSTSGTYSAAAGLENTVVTLRSPSATSSTSNVSMERSKKSVTAGGSGATGDRPRSGSVCSTFSTSSSVVGSARSTSPSVNSVRRGRGHQRKSIADAKRASDRELHRHLQGLLSTKQNLRRCHDEIAKEFSTLTVAVENAADASKKLDSTPEGSLVELLLQGAQTPEEVIDMMTDDGFSENDIRKQLKYVTILQRHHQLLESLTSEAATVLNELSLKDREVQHIATLVDRACDVDLQCMSDTIGDSVMCNGSPMFPNRSIEDTDIVINEASEVCAKAGRLSLYMRKLISTGKADAERSAHDVQLAMSIANRVSTRKLSSAKREIQGVEYEIGRVQVLKAEVVADLEKVASRLDTVDKTIRLRETAKDSIYTRGGTDFVVSAMREEQEELQIRNEELSQRLENYNAELQQLEGDKQEYIDAIGEAQVKVEACRRICARLGTNGLSGTTTVTPTNLGTTVRASPARTNSSSVAAPAGVEEYTHSSRSARGTAAQLRQRWNI